MKKKLKKEENHIMILVLIIKIDMKSKLLVKTKKM